MLACVGGLKACSGAGREREAKSDEEVGEGVERRRERWESREKDSRLTTNTTLPLRISSLKTDMSKRVKLRERSEGRRSGRVRIRSRRSTVEQLSRKFSNQHSRQLLAHQQRGGRVETDTLGGFLVCTFPPSRARGDNNENVHLNASLSPRLFLSVTRVASSRLVDEACRGEAASQ
jgi:hypothetical protein